MRPDARRFATALALAAGCVVSCSKAPGGDPSTRTTSVGGTFDGKATSALGLRPEIAALVDALAEETAIESSNIGAAGAPSKVYAKAKALTDKANDAELVALLGHESPVARGYVAQHLAHAVPAHVRDVVALAADGTRVPTLQGCIGGKRTVGAVVEEALCSSTLREAVPALLAVHAAGGPEGANALACAAPRDPMATTPIALAALESKGLAHPDAASYLRALASAPAPVTPKVCALAREGAAGADASVQIAAADALERCPDGASRAALGPLAAGKNRVVAWHAKAALFLSSPEGEPPSDREVLRYVVGQLEERMKSAVGQRDALAVAERLALARPDDAGGSFYDAAITPEATASARRIAAKLPTSKKDTYGTARVGAITYLARAEDRASLAELTRSLASENATEVTIAIGGVAKLHDKSSRAALEKLAESPVPYVSKAAREALQIL